MSMLWLERIKTMHFLPILTSRLGRYAVGGDDDVWQDEGHLFAELSGALNQVLPAWVQVYCQKNNLNHAISHYDLNAGLLSHTEAPNECSPLTGQTWTSVYQTWHDDLLAQGFKAKITDDNVFYFKPLKNGKFWAVLWCQLLGYGTFVQIKASVWHSLLQVNDERQNGTPSDYDSLMILFANILHNEQTAWFIGNHHTNFIDKNIDDWRKLLPQAEAYWANVHSGGDVIKAIPVEYQRSSYFAQAIEQLRDIQ